MVSLTRPKSLKAIGGAAAIVATTPAISIAREKLMNGNTEGHASINEIAVPLTGYVELTARNSWPRPYDDAAGAYIPTNM